ncbi:MAG: prepilin-type N-terminal cleavage/methylation domain-containing protein [Patescibacteria group bacterium]|nr:prepilin-type N-terminal cleavage/methylation domain-containing protein [Patescibacteria group bacterium]
MRAGFTLIEVLIVLGLLGLLFSIGLPISMDGYRSYVLTSETKNLLSILRRARSLAAANDREISRGVSLESDRFVLFQGLSFAGRDPAFDEDYFRAPLIGVSGLDEIVFSQISGLPNVTTTIVLTNNVNAQTMNVNEHGTISW